MIQPSAIFNQRKNDTFPSDTVQNPRNNGSCMAVTTRSGKILSSPFVGEAVVENMIKEDLDDDSNELGKKPEKKKEVVVTTLPKPPPPFSHRLKNKADDKKFGKFMAMLKQLMINLPLVEALEQMPGYAKFMKELVTKKRTVSYESVDNLHHCSVISTRSLVQKKLDPGSFTIPYTIGSLDFAKALCDFGASINLILLTVYEKLGLGDPTPTNMRLVMADRSVK
ncbi:uncharacterized protein LOC107868629 [Capsicum annuum]|uniref:uncharacterized protein LOC107868629 n=1 Tax=Capsicum annuum TaxID=4072 RepID=UPI0007BFCBAE|nr:uncharacterized protein LOC107868629 [Capsicum annuum]